MSDPFIAEVKLFAGNFAPRGYAYCAGQLLPISQNSALFALLGVTYGGDGRTTFGLPDLRGRVVVGSEGNAAGPGLTPRPLGEKGGAQSVSLSALEIPSHTHSAKAVGPGGNSNDAVGNYWADDAGVSSGTYHSGPATGTMNSNAIGNTGGSQAHTNMQPYLAVNYIIALVGTFPSRN
jgi:microcystin-dependent protein